MLTPAKKQAAFAAFFVTNTAYPKGLRSGSDHLYFYQHTVSH